MQTCPKCNTAYGPDTLLCAVDNTPLGDGTLEGRYRVHRLLGEGGMGVVYQGEHIALRKRVAVKVLKGDLARDPALARRFELEAIAASRIGHEGIVDVTDFGRTPQGALYFVMEYLDGAPLSASVRGGRRLELGRALDVLAQIADALEAAHAHGIVHRDLKPQNVMLLKRRDGGDLVKLLDFGVSKVSTETPERITQQGAILGTAEYMAPEQVNGEADVDARADIYAFGAVAYELVTGTLPFSAKGTLNMLLKHLNEVPEPPSRRAAGLPPALEELIVRSLAKKPEDRPQTMAEVRAALKSIRDALPAAPPRDAPAPAVAPPVEIAPPRASAAPESPATPREAPPPAALPEPRLHDTVISGSRKALATPRPQAPAEPSPRATIAPDTGAPLPEDLALVRRPRRIAALGIGLGALATVGAIALLLRSSSPAPAPAPTPVTEPPRAAVAPAASPTATATTRPTPAPRVTVRSNPPGASVYRGETLLGVTPLTLDDADGELRVTLDGYQPERVRIPAGQDGVDVTLTKASPRPQPPAHPAKKARPYDKIEDLKASPY